MTPLLMEEQANSLSKKIRVLVIDDQRMVVEGVRRMLQTETDMDFFFCTEPSKALETAIGVKPTVILLDLVMPDVGGMTLVRFFKANKKTEDVPIIVLSSIEAPVDKESAFSAGASDYVVKLPDKIELIARIRAHARSFLNKQERDEAFEELRRLKAELEESNSALQTLSCLDGLTGIANRRRFDDYMAQEWKRAQREGSTLSLILIDIDFFKFYNDNYGHQQGDDTLRAVVNALAGGINRPGDLLARYGGEEFVVVLPDTTLDGAVNIAELLKSRVNAMRIPHAFSKVTDHVTLSMGVACCEPGKRFQKFDDLIEAADKALYEAKDSGRNCIRTDSCCEGKCINKAGQE